MRAFSLILACLSAGLLGCSKDEEASSAPPPLPARSSSAEPAAPVDHSVAVNSMGGAANYTPTVTDANAAIKSGDYEKATAYLLHMQRSTTMTLDQGAKHQEAMRALQGRLAEAAMKGDPKAQRAIEVLRRSSSPR